MISLSESAHLRHLMVQIPSSYSKLRALCAQPPLPRRIFVSEFIPMTPA